MDHLPRHLKSRAGNSTPQPPVFGVVSCITFFDSDIDPLVGEPGNPKFHTYRVIMILGSAIQGPFQAIGDTIPNVQEIRLPCDHFSLQAFGKLLNLTEIRDAAMQFADDLARHVEQICREKAPEIAAKNGMSVEQALMPVVGSTTLVLTNRPADKA